MITGVKQGKNPITKTSVSKNGQLTSFGALKQAAVGAFRRFGNQKGKCHKTAELTAKVNGAKGDDKAWSKDTGFRHRPLLALKEGIKSGELKPGMIIYACKNPGTDPSSINMKNGPHWFTYLGKDASGIDRFSDQYSTEFTLDRMNRFIPGRKIDAIFDPYSSKRKAPEAKMAGDSIELSKESKG